MKVAISVGHYPQRQGNQIDWSNKRGKITEYSEGLLVAGHLMNMLVNRGIHTIPVPTGTLTEKIKFINKKRPNYAFEIHFNGFDRGYSGRVQGSECIAFTESREGVPLARLITKSISDRLGNRNRGVIESKRHAFVRDTLYSWAVIIEPFFMYREMMFFEDPAIHQKIAFAVLRGFVSHLNSQR